MESNLKPEVITIEEITKRFEDLTVFEHLSLTIREGEVVVIIGPSGCGKSTLLRCINGLEAIQEGRICFRGEPIDGTSKSAVLLRRKIGMVFQSYELFPHKTILQNVMMAPQIVQKREKAEVEAEALEWLQRVGLLDKKDQYPRQLSGGQKQRAAIVRALCMHPEVLLFDEVTAALDPEMVREVLDVLLTLAGQGRTMAIVTHEMAFAEAIADRVLFLDGGEIVEEGRPESFFKNPHTERARQFLNTFRFDQEKKEA